MRRSGGVRRKSPRRPSPKRQSPSKIRRSKRRLRGGVLKGGQHQLDQILRQITINTEVPPNILDHFSLDVPIPMMNAITNAIEAKDRSVAAIDAAYDAILAFQNTLEPFSEFTDTLYDIPDVKHQLPDVYEACDKIVVDIDKYNMYILHKSKAIRTVGRENKALM